jgi:hypothetical protein
MAVKKAKLKTMIYLMKGIHNKPHILKYSTIFQKGTITPLLTGKKSFTLIITTKSLLIIPQN